MISKDSFVRIMSALETYWSELRVDMDRLGVVYEGNHLTQVFDAVLDALIDDVEADLPKDGYGPWCEYWAFELDWGRESNAVDGVKINDEPRPLQTAEQLYDLLIELKEREE